ncbi:peptidase M4 [Shewanella canadensis]|uniref:Peptidase M4 n=1 Tax=Shewanella canadensis TaxID=271096 RepID=A0A431WUP6_9GAMM|nr:PepSY domain-containing protein [Shewanella canadensis]RTR39173.1 peptidase M4 [Shewanella canadensis]
MKFGSMLVLTTCILIPFFGQASSAQLPGIGAGSMSIATQTSKKSSQQLKVRSREQAIQLVKRQYQGKVLKAQSSRVNGHPGYRVKLISNEGLVFYVSVDAKTGSVRRN